MFSPAHALGPGIVRWYQPKRRMIKLSSKYKGFGGQAGPLFGRTIVRTLRGWRLAGFALGIAIETCDFCNFVSRK
jgi:hypothetical protein